MFIWVKYFKDFNIISVFVMFLFDERRIMIKYYSFVKDRICCFMGYDEVYFWKG